MLENQLKLQVAEAGVGSEVGETGAWLLGRRAAVVLPITLIAWRVCSGVGEGVSLRKQGCQAGLQRPSLCGVSGIP